MALDGGIAPARVAWRRWARAAGRAVVLLLHGISGSQQALAPVSGKSILMRDGHPGGWARRRAGYAPYLRAGAQCVGSCFGSSAPDAECPPRFPTSPSPTACACRAVVARAGRCAAGCGGGLFLRRLSGVPVGARSARATRAGAGAGVRRGGGSWSDVIALRAWPRAGRRCLGARAVGRGAAGRLDALAGPVVGRCRRARAGQALDAEGAPGRRAFALVDGPCGRQPAAMTSATRSRPCAPLYWLRCASDLLFPPGDETALPCVHPMTVADAMAMPRPRWKGRCGMPACAGRWPECGGAGRRRQAAENCACAGSSSWRSADPYWILASRRSFW